MSNVHIYAPEPTDESFRVLRKGCRQFQGGPFTTWETAMRYGVRTCHEGFRVFHQRGYEWYDPSNTEVIKVSADLTKEVKETTDEYAEGMRIEADIDRQLDKEDPGIQRA